MCEREGVVNVRASNEKCSICLGRVRIDWSKEREERDKISFLRVYPIIVLVLLSFSCALSLFSQERNFENENSLQNLFGSLNFFFERGHAKNFERNPKTQRIPYIFSYYEI